MNARTSEFVGALRALLATLPGASAISIHASAIWTLVAITAESNEAVRTLGLALELGAPELRTTAEHWWHCATAEHDRGALCVEVIGPRQRRPTPPSAAR